MKDEVLLSPVSEVELEVFLDQSIVNILKVWNYNLSIPVGSD